MVRHAVLNCRAGSWSGRGAEPSLVSVVDINHDGVLQLGELHITPDILVLAAPEIGGMPFAVSCLVAAGGHAAALSTADGLLHDDRQRALSHDLYFNIVHRGSPPQPAGGHIQGEFCCSWRWWRPTSRCSGRRAILLLVTPVFSGLPPRPSFPPSSLGVAWRRATCGAPPRGWRLASGSRLYYLLTRPFGRHATTPAAPGCGSAVNPRQPARSGYRWPSRCTRLGEPADVAATPRACPAKESAARQP